MKDFEIFNKRERRLLYLKKPDLKPIRVPTLNDAKTIRIPSINEVKLLTEPSIDQIIIQFLKQYDVKVKPRSVGEFNGWDALSALTTFYSANEKNSSFNVASSILMANRSNQVNSAAQDWGTWKRWALDHKNFEQFKDDVIKNITLHNENATKEVEEAIRKAEIHNKNAIEEIKQSITKAELHNENLCKKLLDPEIKKYVSQLVENDNNEIALRKKKLSKISRVLLISISSIAFVSICFVFINKRIIKHELKTTFAEGEKELEAGKYWKARNIYKEALKIDPNFEKAKLGLIRTDNAQAKEFFDLGEKRFNDERFFEAISLYKKA